MPEPLVAVPAEHPPAPKQPLGSSGQLAARAPAARVPSAPAATVAEAAPADSSEEEVSGAGEVGDAVAAAPGPAASRLSLTELGVGDTNPFLRPGDPAAARAEKAARVKRRLDRALAQGLMDSETASGRGAGGPVLRSLEAAVYASTAPLNGRCSFVFIIDGDGKLVSSSVGEASGEREAWSRVARQTAQSLAQRKLTVPKGKSVRLTVAVSSHLELPSGADPGVAVDVLGLPLKRGSGPRSTKVDLLNPRNPLSPLSLRGDPADLGQNARRMVHAHVVSEELL